MPWAEEMLGTREFSERELTPWASGAARRRGRGRSTATWKTLNDSDGTTGAAPFPLNARGTTRWNTAFAYLDLARGRPNLTVVADALVDHRLWEGGFPLSAPVVADAEIRARRLVLCAGVHASPAILLQRIGPADEPVVMGSHRCSTSCPLGTACGPSRRRGQLGPVDLFLDRRMRAHGARYVFFFEPQGACPASKHLVCDDDTWDAYLLPWVNARRRTRPLRGVLRRVWPKPVSRAVSGWVISRSVGWTGHRPWVSLR